MDPVASTSAVPYTVQQDDRADQATRTSDDLADESEQGWAPTFPQRKKYNLAHVMLSILGFQRRGQGRLHALPLLTSPSRGFR